MMVVVDGKLSGGEIAGIVMGSLTGIAFIIAMHLLIILQNRKRKTIVNNFNPRPPPPPI